MTEDEARAYVDVSRGTLLLLEKYVALIHVEQARQNLVSPSTLGMIWSRHVADSAQLAPLLRSGSLVDIGSGAGFPGIVLAAITDLPTLLVEPRRKRAQFLADCAAALGLRNVAVRQTKAEAVTAVPAASITARAVAPLPALFAAAAHLADGETRWILPKGRSAQSELAAARATWHGAFRIVVSVTDPDSAIVVADGVGRRAGQGASR